MADVLSAAGLQPAAAHIAFEAPDVSQLATPSQGLRRLDSAAKAVAGETLRAWAMNGEPLTALHGAPLRVMVPGWIWARSVKWVQRITARREPSDN